MKASYLEAVAALVLVVSCGGTVEPGGEGGTSAAGAGGTAQGGQGGKGGGGIGGSGVGGIAGTGAYGGAGGSSWGGQAGSGGSVCPPPPACNWCGGNPLYDGQGCIAGYVCKNGVNPCATQPCTYSKVCSPNETCGSDGLCWPVVCEPGPCAGSSNSCECKWQCSDGNTYGFACQSNGASMSCNCMLNGSSGSGCAMPSSPALCQAGYDCCGFPH